MPFWLSFNSLSCWLCAFQASPQISQTSPQLLSLFPLSVHLHISFVLQGSNLFCSSEESPFVSPSAYNLFPMLGLRSISELQHWEYLRCPLFLIVTLSYSMLFWVNYLSKEGLLILSVMQWQCGLIIVTSHNVAVHI